jgi:glycosyltransferase involved in cell wall biosynthesis
MRLVIQIPCLDEEESLPTTLRDLPTTLPGFDAIETVVVDDGSGDRTAEIAERLGAHVVKVPRTRGLAHAFMAGIETSLARGADVIVNTDADNQYAGEDIAKLVEPILRGEADVVIGARPIRTIESFSASKRLLQRLGSWTVRKLSGTQVLDATSGFRAFSREAALRLNVFSRYTYTLETIVQTAQRNLRVISVPVRVNPVLRSSRLVRSNLDYVWRNGSALLRMSVVYRPFRFFMIPAIAAFALATAIGLRFIWYFLASEGVAGHLQSLILAAILYGVSASLAVVAFVGDLLAINRRLLEDLQLDGRRRRLEARRFPGV